MVALHEHIADTLEFIQTAKRIVALTGAGISTASGIPDFRSPGSIWQQQSPVSYQDFLQKPEARQRYWRTRSTLMAQMKAARPNAAHHALVALEHQQRLAGIITQNFDGLHQDAGQQPERVIELHGTSRHATCTLCGANSSMPALQQRIDGGEIDPQCSLCGGYLKAATILFGQRVPTEKLQQAKELTANSDLFLVIGSSLKVTPAAILPRLALQRNIPLVILNLTPTSLDPHADIVIHQPASSILPQLTSSL